MSESRAERLLAMAKDARSVAENLIFEAKRRMISMAKGYERLAEYYQPDPDGDDPLYSGLSFIQATPAGYCAGQANNSHRRK